MPSNPDLPGLFERMGRGNDIPFSGTLPCGYFPVSLE